MQAQNVQTQTYQTVYRLQNDKGFGPYLITDMSDKTRAIMKLLNDHNGVNSMNNHPTPSFDKGIERESLKYEHCAFDSMEQLTRWFTPLEIEELHKFGYEVVTIPDVIVTAKSDHQVLFVFPADYEAFKQVSPIDYFDLMYQRLMTALVRSSLLEDVA